MTVMPLDKGSSLVFALLLSGLTVLRRRRRCDDPTGREPALVAGSALVLAGVLVATVPGIAGEEGLPLLPAAAAVLLVGTWRGEDPPVVALGGGGALASVVLVAVAPLDTTRFLSGELPGPREAAFLGAGLTCLAGLCGVAHVIGRQRELPALSWVARAVATIAGAIYLLPLVVARP